MRATTRRGAVAPEMELHNGDRLTQAEFHRRYEAYPEDVKFELVGGVVHMASPLRRPHGTTTPKISLVLALYGAHTPGVEAASDMTTILGEASEPQPDLMLRLLTEYRGQSKYNEDDYLIGAPELVVEVAHSTVSLDMNAKRKDYLAAGVQEYAVYCAAEGELHWWHFPSKRRLKADRGGVWKSRAFPGLWLDGPALVARDTAKLLATAQRGLATPQHAAFVRRLERRRRATGER